MNGRFLKIKKSLLLKIMMFFLFVCFVVITTLEMVFWKLFDLWFFNFCFAVGIFQLIKNLFFKLDSALYLGFLLIFVGIAGYVFIFTNILPSAPFYLSFAFVLSSVFTFIGTGQKFHLVLAYSISFVTIFAFLLQKKLITLSIFIAIIVSFLVLLVVETFFRIKRRR